MEKTNFLYKQLYDSLLDRITSGQYPAGSRLPAESVLRKEFQVSSITVKKALSLLAEGGFIFRIPGKGTFVNDGMKAAPESPASRSGQIGVVLEHVATPFGLEMMYRMDQAAERAGFKLCIRFSYGDQKKEAEEIAFLISQGVSGLIVMPSHGNHYNTEILKLVVEKFPVVLIDKRLDGIPVSSVRTDNYAAASQLVMNLAQSGCRKISLIMFKGSGATSLEERQHGFYDKLSALGLSAGEECLLPFPSDVDMVDNTPKKAVVEFLKEYLLKTKGGLDGVVCMEYGTLPPFLLAAKAADVPVGTGAGKLKVCCFDEDYLAPNGYYFTHVKQDETGIAEKAVSLLISQIRGGANTMEDYKIPAVFHQGHTT